MLVVLAGLASSSGCTMSHPVGGDGPLEFEDGGSGPSPDDVVVPDCVSVPPSASPVAYVANFTRTYLPPIPSVTGVAGSEAGLWLIGSGDSEKSSVPSRAHRPTGVRPTSTSRGTSS